MWQRQAGADTHLQHVRAWMTVDRGDRRAARVVEERAEQAIVMRSQPA